MNHKQTILDFLEAEPHFRERANKDMGIAKLLTKEHNALYQALKSSPLTFSIFVKVLQNYATMDRAWRQALEKNPHLRGKDYGQKEKLEIEKQIELGYNVKPHPQSTQTLLGRTGG